MQRDGQVRELARSGLGTAHGFGHLADLGALASTVAQWNKLYCASGKPILSTAKKVEIAMLSAAGAAMPTSAEAKITIRRATNLGSSPACNMRAR